MPLDLIRQIRAFYAECVAAHHEASAHVPTIVAGLERCAQPHSPAPASLAPVERHLEEALGLGRGRGHDALLDAIAEARDALVWYSCESAYGDPPAYRHFFDNYAFAILVGPGTHGFESLYRDSRLLCGLTIQTPGVHYPAHAHPAVEVYGVLGGTARWRRGGLGRAPAGQRDPARERRRPRYGNRDRADPRALRLGQRSGLSAHHGRRLTRPSHFASAQIPCGDVAKHTSRPEAPV